jgi:hypothetical protein
MSVSHLSPPAPAPRTNWQAPFLALLPAIQRHAHRELKAVRSSEREEALQAAVAYAAVAFARLVELNKAHLAYAAPLAHYGLKHYRSGRQIGGRANCRDVCSTRCQCRRGYVMEPLEDWKEILSETRRTSPAEIAALRVDFGDWLRTLSPRNRKLAKALALGEETRAVAKMFRVTAGRVSQLRRELYESWLRFLGEPVSMAS